MYPIFAFCVLCPKGPYGLNQLAPCPHQPLLLFVIVCSFLHDLPTLFICLYFSYPWVVKSPCFSYVLCVPGKWLDSYHVNRFSQFMSNPASSTTLTSWFPLKTHLTITTSNNDKISLKYHTIAHEDKQNNYHYVIYSYNSLLAGQPSIDRVMCWIVKHGG